MAGVEVVVVRIRITSQTTAQVTFQTLTAPLRRITCTTTADHARTIRVGQRDVLEHVGD